MAGRRNRDTPPSSAAASRGKKGALGALVFVGLATGAAFAGGSHLRARFTHQMTGGPGGSTRLAQSAQSSGGAARMVGRGGYMGNGTLNAEPAVGQDDEEGLGAAELFREVHRHVRDNYVDKLPDANKLSHGAIRAMLAELDDPHSRFLEPEERQALTAQEQQGRYAGIGAALRLVDTKRDGYTEHHLVVAATLPGSPAQKAGLRAGDVVARVDGKYVLTSDPFLALNRVVKRIESGEATEDDVEKLRQGQETTQKKLTSGIALGEAQRRLTLGTGEKRMIVVQRPGEKEPITVELTTGATTVPAPIARPLASGGALYIQVPALTGATAKAVGDLLAQSAPAGRGVVLDLRDNPGGPLAAMRQVAGLFAPAPAAAKGNNAALLMLQSARGKRSPVLAAAPASGAPAPRPLVVLVNKGTAGEAEGLAAALRDRSGATLIGGRTFGDALVQTLYPLADGSGYTLTTGKLLGAASGASWQDAGLTPAVALNGNVAEEQVLARAVSVLKSRGAKIADAAP